eukprot:761747-Hanusia_phi.AAC.5
MRVGWSMKGSHGGERRRMMERKGRGQTEKERRRKGRRAENRLPMLTCGREDDNVSPAAALELHRNPYPRSSSSSLPLLARRIPDESIATLEPRRASRALKMEQGG